MQKITPFLWFDNKGEEAMNFYVSIFKNSKVISAQYNTDDTFGPKGSLFTASFQLEGQEFQLINGGPQYQFTEAVSLVVNCETQAEVDHLWNKLVEGGKEQACGWLKDKYGLSWQIIPTVLEKLIWDKSNPKKAQAAMQAMLKMVKLDINALQTAYDNA
jgi:predicted 3-demethylubiquinone-9 3-methyltransferase (glyoxalase superfamily)